MRLHSTYHTSQTQGSGRVALVGPSLLLPSLSGSVLVGWEWLGMLDACTHVVFPFACRICCAVLVVLLAIAL